MTPIWADGLARAKRQRCLNGASVLKLYKSAAPKTSAFREAASLALAK